MKVRILLIGIINLIFWAIALIYIAVFKQPLDPFLNGLLISFSISTLIGAFSSIHIVFISILLAWGLWLLAYFEGFPSDFLAGCATAFTMGVILGFILSRPA